MDDFTKSVHAFLEFRQYQILEGKGKISKPQAEKKATEEYDAFNKQQKIISDFDKAVKATLKKETPNE
jgi:hypothetical protein